MAKKKKGLKVKIIPAPVKVVRKLKFPSIIVRTTQNPGVELIQRMMMILLAGHRCGEPPEITAAVSPSSSEREKKVCPYLLLQYIGCVKVHHHVK